MIKIKVRNWIGSDCSQIAILPELTYWWSASANCLGFGWLFILVEIWWGKVENLV